MTHSLTTESRKALTLANTAARSFKHTYVGTEHILLGLIEERSGRVSDILATLGIDADRICAEIEKIVHSGNEQVTLRTLPLTPRANQAIEIAHDEARLMDELCIRPEHLLLGLMSDPSGVACQVLVNLGTEPAALRKEVFKTRLAQMKIVERAVRPLLASTQRKRKIREEMLAHLSAIYDQELSKLHNPAIAMEAAAARFGNPEEIAEQMQAALPFNERISYFVERWFAWWPPESAARYSLRQSILTFGILATVLPSVFVSVILRYGWFNDVWTLVRVFTSIILFTPPAHFIAILAWIKMRDSLWGVFGSSKSIARAAVYGMVTATAVMAAFVGFVCAARWSFSASIDAAPIAAAAGLIFAFFSYLNVRVSGPATIRDTLWATLDTKICD